MSHPNVVAAATSFSKPYGLLYYRVGFTLCREPIPALYANKWFKNVFGLLVADKILDEIDPVELARKYQAIQAGIVEQINKSYELGLSASDAFLLARLPVSDAAQLPGERRDVIGKFKRGDWYRFCLTPYFEEYEAFS